MYSVKPKSGHYTDYSFPGGIECNLLYTGVASESRGGRRLCPHGASKNVTFDAAFVDGLVTTFPKGLMQRSRAVPVFANQWSVSHHIPEENGRAAYAQAVADSFVQRGVGSTYWIWKTKVKMDSWANELEHRPSDKPSTYEYDTLVIDVLNAAWSRAA